MDTAVTGLGLALRLPSSCPQTFGLPSCQHVARKPPRKHTDTFPTDPSRIWPWTLCLASSWPPEPPASGYFTHRQTGVSPEPHSPQRLAWTPRSSRHTHFARTSQPLKSLLLLPGQSCIIVPGHHTPTCAPSLTPAMGPISHGLTPAAGT